MILLIDAGNTNTVFAICDDNGKLSRPWRSTTEAARTADEYAVFLLPLLELAGISYKSINRAIVSSVVPQATFNLLRLCEVYFSTTPLIIGETDIEIGVAMSLARPEEVGADRLVNALAGTTAWGYPLVIIDFGTATTFDVIDAQGVYCGGVIAPGINLSLDALHRATAKLPRLAIERPAAVTGSSTATAMRSGIFWGYVGLIEGILSRLNQEHGITFKVVATGGLAGLFANDIPAIMSVDRDLTLRGLALIAQKEKLIF